MIRTEYNQSLEVRQTSINGVPDYTAQFRIGRLDASARGWTHEHALAMLATEMGRALADRITGTLTMYS